MAGKEEKTNAMRILTQCRVPYEMHDYTSTGAISGSEVAKALGEDPEKVFKTLVTVGKSGSHYVFMIPVEKELDMKKGAGVVGEKYIEMIPSKDLLPLTGYIHGGCSPIGMKKTFMTVIDASAQNWPQIFFSGGRIGLQVEVPLGDLPRALRFTFADVAKD